jgi:TolB-like protein/Tfp pilus assembly protein PilF
VTDAPIEPEGLGTWTMLRRRKVVQWGLVYLAGAWGLLQGLEYVSESFHWPEELRQIALLSLLIGLPIVLVLAWYHGDRGQRRITTPEFAILMVLLLLGGGVFWYYQRASEAARTEAAQPGITAQRDTASEIKDARPSIAVLPFENRTREADDAFFVDGIHGDILTQLSKVSALRVISRTSVEQFRDTKLPMNTIAGQLGVTKILEGGVQRAGDRVRINVQLIDAATDGHLWAESYDRELTAANIFAIQSELAQAIAGALKAALTPAEQARSQIVPTQNLEAWEAYQLGKQRFAKRTSTGIADAEHFFREATALDPRFALAWVGVTDALNLQTDYHARSKVRLLAEAEKTVAKALELDPNLAEAWTSSGNIAKNRLQFARAEPLFRRAIALNPNYATAHHWLSLTLAALGRRQEALAEAERAVALDPLSAIINNLLGSSRENLGRFDDALTAYKRVIQIDPAMPHGFEGIGRIQAYGLGHLDRAPPWFEQAATLDSGNTYPLASLAQLYWELGDDAEAHRWLSRAIAIGEPDAFTNAVASFLNLDQGNQEAARRYAQAAAELEPFYVFLMRDIDLRKDDYIMARSRYAKAFPELFGKELPRLTDTEAFAALELAIVLQHTGEDDRARALLERSEVYVRTIPRMGAFNSWYSDARIAVLRGENEKALALLREAKRAGCRWLWRYYRDYDPVLAPIRNDPEFKAIFADIERDMAQQRARLAARPKDAPLEMSVVAQ